MTHSYQQQHRGDSASYAHYFAGMDKSMCQKVALVTSFFPTKGTVADMGSGSGRGSFDIANLYPGLRIVGVDISTSAIEYSNRNYQRPNLRFEVGDISKQIFSKNSLDGILNSSVLHHVTSFNNFDLRQIDSLLDNQVAQLREGGILAIRDFVIPSGPEEVLLTLPSGDGIAKGSIAQLSTASLFKEFAQHFRCAAFPHGGIPQEISSESATHTTFRTSMRLAAEFLLRKDYRENWNTELLEEYLYFSQAEFERALSSRGLRIVLSKPLYNPWIIRNRLEGKFSWTDLDGAELPMLPTNYIIIGEKTSQGVSLHERSSSAPRTPSYLTLEHFSDGTSTWDVVSRPHPTVDIIPWYRNANDILVLCRQGYPRPIANAAHGNTPLDGSRISGYINEPISAVVESGIPERTLVERVLYERTGLHPAHIKGITQGLRYFPSPGGVNECVQSIFVEIVSPWVSDLKPITQTGFASQALIRPVSAAQTLRAYQVGGMFDSRLEINLYELLLRQQENLGPWIGEDLSQYKVDRCELSVLSPSQFNLRGIPGIFTKVKDGAGFLQVHTAEFVELNRHGQEIATQRLEYVTPVTMSTNTGVILPYIFTDSQLYIGLESRDLPAVQSHGSHSKILTLPAWRIPKAVTSERQMRGFLATQAARQFELPLTQFSPLGGAYYPTIGATPESVSLFACPVAPANAHKVKLHWCRVADLLEQRALLEDGHLFTGLFRLAHAVYGDALQLP
ncbi:MAG: class I SAM-dependent methyltransferase [Proteobacteria bacterium]|nr:class I SAM-dependent methyltransferase [Pseudomonadota bacterium]